MMASADVTCEDADAGAGGTRDKSGGAASNLSSTTRIPPTTFIIPCASKNAAIATSARMTAQKWRRRSLSIAMETLSQARWPASSVNLQCETHATSQDAVTIHICYRRSLPVRQLGDRSSFSAQPSDKLSRAA